MLDFCAIDFLVCVIDSSSVSKLRNDPRTGANFTFNYDYFLVGGRAPLRVYICATITLALQIARRNVHTVEREVVTRRAERNYRAARMCFLRMVSDFFTFSPVVAAAAAAAAAAATIQR